MSAFAVNWTKIVVDRDRHTYYVDISDIKKHNGLIYYWELLNMEDVSAIRKYKVECGEEKQTFLGFWFRDQCYKLLLP